MPTILGTLLLIAPASAAVIVGTPELLPVINDKLRYWSPSSAQWMPDGKMVAFCENTSNPQSDFIFNIPLDFRMRGPNNKVNNVTSPAAGNRSEYPNALPWREGTNYVRLPNDIPIPSADVTGTRGDGTHYDYNDRWLMNAFRLSETSQPDAPINDMIAFVHNEDYWGYGGAYNGCTYKSIGVRYSHDLGKSWTRSVPIITKSVQLPVDQISLCNNKPRAGTGDLAGIWNHLNKTWVIFGHEDEWTTNPYTSPRLVMSISTDPLARPGNWTRLDPINKKTAPGFIGDKNSLFHPDLSGVPGSNPTIIRDSKNNVWHMVWSRWGGGLSYANTTDFVRFSTPADLRLNGGYPTLIGDQGDALTTGGKATLYYTGGDNNGYWGKPIRSVGIDFNPITQNANVREQKQQTVSDDQIVLDEHVDLKH